MHAICREADTRQFGAVQRFGQISGGLRYGFGAPQSDPLLWLADAVAGATATALGEGDRTCLDTLGDVAVVEV